jgi:patatin-like phospholipase/acyl hydrolase
VAPIDPTSPNPQQAQKAWLARFGTTFRGWLNPPHRPQRLLSFDSGGIRGALTARILQRLEAERPGIVERSDLLAGSSAGGILALALAAGRPPKSVVDLFVRHGPEIFHASHVERLLHIGGLQRPTYENSSLRSGLEELLGTTTLGQLTKPVLICAFRLDNHHVDPEHRCWMPWYFHNLKGSVDLEVRASQIALRTSAAPVFFPAVDGFVDGAIFANHPGPFLLAHAMDPLLHERPGHLGELRMLSLGTGEASHFIADAQVEWGVTRWLRHLAPMVTDAQTRSADQVCHQLLEERYQRIDPTLPAGREFPIDGVGLLDELLAVADKVELGSTLKWLDRHWFR